MPDMKEQTDAWVFYNPASGGIIKIALREPTAAMLPKPGSGQAMFRTRLSRMAIHHTQALRVQNGRVVHMPSLGGI